VKIDFIHEGREIAHGASDDQANFSHGTAVEKGAAHAYM
jgi:hypothetical protein